MSESRAPAARKVSARSWPALAVAVAGVAVVGAAQAGGIAGHNPTGGPERIWLAQSEGGEGGEGGAVAEVSDEIAYLARLAIVEGHMRGAVDLYDAGLKDEAIGLSYHPEAEMMDEVRAALAAHKAADITPAMQALSTAMEAGADSAAVKTAMDDVSDVIASAMAAASPTPKVRFSALVALMKGAATEYSGAVEGGTVTDVMPLYEAQGFVQVARGLATSLAETPDVAAAGAKALSALDGADEAFKGLEAGTPEAGDPSILAAVAARVELAAGAVR